MKSERLYAITMYLLNHGRTSASELARHFEVSVRTIQRDIDSLCCAGIPVAALTGANGGYEIAQRFELESHAATKRDYSWIFTALRGLVTATNDPGASRVLEKIGALLSLGDSAEVIGPESLRQRIRQTAEKIVSLYSRGMT